MGFFSSNPEVAIASEVSILSKNSLAITDVLTEETQLVNYCENPFLEPPHSRIPTESGHGSPRNVDFSGWRTGRESPAEGLLARIQEVYAGTLVYFKHIGNSEHQLFPTCDS